MILDDRSARLEVSLYEEIFQQHRDIIVKDAILMWTATSALRRFSSRHGGCRQNHCMDIDRARERFARRLCCGGRGIRWSAGPESV